MIIGRQNEHELVIGFRLILKGLGLDESDPHFKGTPERAAKAWFHELCRGITGDPPDIATFPTNTDEMVVLREIPIRSLCAHHLLPFVGVATIGYIPGKDQLLGLSKLSRIADHQARRPQVQEVLTGQIADEVATLVMKLGNPEGGGVGVIIRARHMCMELRGVEHGGEMITSAMRGVFLTKPEARAEFLKLVTGNS